MRTSTAKQRHDFDPIAFIFGLLFTGSGVLFMIGRFDLFNHARWLWPGLLVLLGIAVLVGTRGRASQARDRQLSAEPAVGAPDLDAIEPPIGPEAFRLPGWPAPGEPPRAAAGSSTDVMEPVAPSGREGGGRADAPEGADTPQGAGGPEGADTAQGTEAETRITDAGVDPEAETQVMRERPPEPPPSR